MKSNAVVDIEKLLEERSKTHGPYDLFASVCQKLKVVSSGYNDNMSHEHREALDMILHKVARIVTGNPNVKDHWDDIAGYATLGSKSIKDVWTQETPPEEPKKAEESESAGQGHIPYPPLGSLLDTPSFKTRMEKVYERKIEKGWD